MPTLQIDGVGRVQVGDEFSSLSPADQEALVHSIVDQAGKGVRSSLGSPSIGDSAADIGKSMGAGVAEGSIRLPFAVPDFASGANRLFNAGVDRGLSLLGIDPGKPATSMTPLGDVVNGNTAVAAAKQAVPALDYSPQTRAGKYAKTVGQALPGAVAAPGGIISNAIKFGVIPGLASEAAGEATSGTKMEPYARVGAGLISGGLASMATAPALETRMVAQATRGADDAAIGQAGQLMQEAQGRGVPLTWAEALQQVTNNGTQAGRLQRVIEGTKEGGAVMAPAMAQRPGQVQQAVGSTLDTIAPATSPTTTALRAQQAGSDAIGAVNQRINSAEAPYYAAASTKTVPPQDLQLIAQDPAFQRALQSVRSDPIRNKGLENFGANEVPVLIAVRKELARMADNAMSPGAGMNPDRELARGITPIQNRLDQIITNTAPEYGQALGVGSGLRQQVLDPLKAGPLGQIAREGSDLPAQTGALFPAAPFEGQAAETGRAIGLLNAQDATAAPALVRQHLASKYAEAAQNLQPGPNQFGGAKFAATVAGNPIQRETLEAGLSALPNGPQALPEVQGLLRVLEATGKRQQPGSLTAFNSSDLKDMGSTGLLGASVDSAKSANPMPLISQLKDKFDRARLGARSENIARGLLAQPEDAVRALIEARRRAPVGLLSRNLAGLLLANEPELSK